MAADFDFFDSDFQKNSHRNYQRLIAECPVAHGDVPYDWYAVTREADIRTSPS